uniref:Uncharacterized protein n=1 Tax=Arundo donax TaxID=35708 RepID=A0A0A8ZDE9_ARUDO
MQGKAFHDSNHSLVSSILGVLFMLLSCSLIIPHWTHWL